MPLLLGLTVNKIEKNESLDPVPLQHVLGLA